MIGHRVEHRLVGLDGVTELVLLEIALGAVELPLDFYCHPETLKMLRGIGLAGGRPAAAEPKLLYNVSRFRAKPRVARVARSGARVGRRAILWQTCVSRAAEKSRAPRPEKINSWIPG